MVGLLTSSVDASTQMALMRLEKRWAYRWLKRLFDVSFSIAALVALSPFLAIIAIAIKTDDPKGPVLFRQTRIGKKGKPFVMYKFRSLCVDAESKLAELQSLNEVEPPVFKIKKDPRVTKVGRFIRKISADELPQFFNVIKGDISVVGPRPPLPHEVDQYTDYQKQRLSIKPGITCYWQTRRNRDSISFDEWVELDLRYIKKCGFRTDIKLIIQTIGVVLSAQGY